MSTHDIADPTVQEADQRAERAKASLLSRVELLKHKLTDVRQKLDLPGQITRYPLPVLGAAFALGALAGLRRTSSTAIGEPAERSLHSTAIAALTAIGLRALRNIALAQLGQIAKQWWAEHGEHGEYGEHSERPSPARGSSIEPPLEH
jgi:hypothetical protein